MALAAGGWRRRRRRRGAPSPICKAEGRLLLRLLPTTLAAGWACLRKRGLGDSRALGAQRSAGTAEAAYKLAGGGAREIGLPETAACPAFRPCQRGPAALRTGVAIADSFHIFRQCANYVEHFGVPSGRCGTRPQPGASQEPFAANLGCATAFAIAHKYMPCASWSPASGGGHRRQEAWRQRWRRRRPAQAEEVSAQVGCCW